MYGGIYLTRCVIVIELFLLYKLYELISLTSACLEILQFNVTFFGNIIMYMNMDMCAQMCLPYEVNLERYKISMHEKRKYEVHFCFVFPEIKKVIFVRDK